MTTTRREAAARLNLLLGEVLGELQVEKLPSRLRSLADELEDVGGLATQRPDEDSDLISIWSRLFSEWRTIMGKPRAMKTPGRRQKVLARLREGYTEDQIRLAIHGCAGSDFHREGGHDDLTLICRSGEKLEGFIARAPADVVVAKPKDDEHARKVRAMRLARDEGRTEDYERLNRELAASAVR